MAECYFCKTHCVDECHLECSAERERRLANGTCVRCGKNPVVKGKAWCSECHLYSAYKDYPGGSA